MITDVQDILNVPSTPADQPITKDLLLGDKKKSKKIETTFKRPEGMNREVFNLLVGEKDVPPLVPTDTAAKLGGYKNIKARLGLRRVRPWRFSPFLNPARQDQLQISHWRRIEDEDKEYPFARFNKVLEIPQFTKDDYAKYLTSLKWTLDETEFLFELCTRFDLRWPIVHDRWDSERFTARTIEDLKERFYDICNKLIQVRTPENEEKKFLSFDADHERRRKEQLEKLWNRTDEQIEEEESLLTDLRRIEMRKKERAKKAQDLQKLISAVDRSPATPVTPANQSTAPKKKFYNKGNTPSTSTIETLNIEAASGVRFPEFKGSGVHLRSQRTKLPPTLGQKKIKAIDVALEKLGLELHPTATEEVVCQFNELRSDILLLYELKSALSSCEFELESLKHQYRSQTGIELPIPAHLRATREETGAESTSPFKRRIADSLEVTTGPTPQVGRKKKLLSTSMDQSNLIKKLRKL